MIAERVLEDVGRSSCLALRLFLSECFNRFASRRDVAVAQPLGSWEC